MPSRKRASQALEDELTEHSTLMLHRIRNMWQFANFCQWLYIFGKAAKIDDSLDIEDIETECLKPNSTTLAEIALALLKLVSSHRGLTHDIFDAQARKQFAAKSSGHNPFGAEDAPQCFADFDIFTKIKVLQQLTQWAMMHPELLRDHMQEQKDVEQTTWRIEPYGWDSQDRTYYVLDDNRIYRLSYPPLKSKPKLAKPSAPSHGRHPRKRRHGFPVASSDMDNEDSGLLGNAEHSELFENNGLGGMHWECIAITLSEVQHLLGTMARTRDENEKILRKQLEEHLVPILERQEETRKRKELQRERDLLNQAKMANAKRSSRIANKMNLQKLEEIAKAERQQIEEEEEARRRQEKRRQEIERERASRFLSRERRLREREARRLCHEERLSQLSDEQRGISTETGRVSKRRLKVEIDRTKQALKDLEKQEEPWVFDCSCGMHGQVDDGTHCVACEKCNIWQHSKCLGISRAVADQPDFQFICTSCSRQRDEEERSPRTSIRLELHVTTTPSYPHRPTWGNGSEGAISADKTLCLPSPRHSNTSTLVPLSPESPQSPQSAHADVNESPEDDKDLARTTQKPATSHSVVELAPLSTGHVNAAPSGEDLLETFVP